MSRLTGEQITRLVSVLLLVASGVPLLIWGSAEVAQAAGSALLTGAVVIAGGAMRRPS